MKNCPFCAEEIQDEAIVCRHCGRELAPQKVAQVSETLINREGISHEPEPKGIECPECGEFATDPNPATCFLCGHEFSSRDLKSPVEKKRRSAVKLGFGISLILGGIGAIFQYF